MDGGLRPLGTLYGVGGPYTTVYLDVDPQDLGDADNRWAALRDAATDGTDDDDLEAVEEVLLARVDVHARGRVIVACQGRVVLREQVPSGAGDRARTAPLPDLFPYVARRLRVVPNLVVVPSGEQLQVLRATPSGHLPLWPLDGGQETFERAFARLAAEVNPQLVVVAGDYADCRAAVARISRTRMVMPDVVVRMVDADPADPAAVAATVESALRKHLQPEVDAARRAVTGRGRGTAVGPAAVVDALRMAQARTVVVGARTELPDRCWIGPRPTEFGLRDRDAARLGVSDPQHDRYDAALVRALAATGTRLVVLQPGEAPPPGGIAASLRD